MFDELILHGDQILAKSIFDDGSKVVIPVRLPWYRNLSIAVVEMLNFTIDGRKYESKKDEVKLQFLDGAVSIQETSTAPKYKKEIWCNLDVQRAEIELDAPLADGEHEVEMEMLMGLPYKLPIDVPPTFPQFVTYKKTMTFKKGEI